LAKVIKVHDFVLVLIDHVNSVQLAKVCCFYVVYFLNGKKNRFSFVWI